MGVWRQPQLAPPHQPQPDLRRSVVLIPTREVAAATPSMGSLTLDATATFTPGTHTTTAALALGSETLAAASTFSPGTHTATAALTTGSLSAAASVVFTAPVFAAAGSLTTHSLSVSASVTFSPPVFHATAALSISDILLSSTVQDRWLIAGVTRDCTTSAPIPGCAVAAFVTSTNEVSGTGVSDAGGNYSISVPTPGEHFLVAYLPGSPDVAGTTRNDIVGV